MVSRGIPRRALATLAALFTAVLAAGCVSMPTGGPVQSYPVTQGTGAPNQPNVQFQPQLPGDGWDPQQIVQGFLAASASFGDYSQVALQYLTPQERKAWNYPTYSAVIYKNGPNVAAPVYPKSAKTSTTATVQVTGAIQATLEGSSYSVPSTATAAASAAPPAFQLVKEPDGRWRISVPPPEMLLTSASFANDYQLRNLYFFDPTGSYLVPDPIYVPLRAPGDLMNVLVQDLIKPPKDDWLWRFGGATKTALPADTKIGGITVDGVTAHVNLTGSIAKARRDDPLLQQVSSQLVWTLTGSGQSGPTGAVQSVVVELNSNPWFPPGSPGNPVQQKQQNPKVAPPTGASPVYYYLDSSGYLVSRKGAGKPKRLAPLGPKFTQVAVSPDGRYLAALRGQVPATLYTGLVGGSLTKRGDGYAAISWDANDDLWTAVGQQIVMFRAPASLRQPPGQLTPVAVDVISSLGSKHLTVPYTALRVAPDGVRVAIVIANDELTFGAISGQDQAPQIVLSPVQLSPLNASQFTGLTWYGADNVITLAQQPGPAATEYSVSGGNPTSIPVEPGMLTITGSMGNLLIAGLADGSIVADNSLTGSWMPLGSGAAPAYAG